ncbi:MAG TPA: DUF5714 domain-containing protein [Desulfobacteria bacterium]|nr:DUF5714 domain-containing protein [Desulfobacteria bacterium]
MEKGKFKEECMVCGSVLEYLDTPVSARCIYCGREEQSYFRCPHGHFVCNHCHANEAVIKITQYCLASSSANPSAMLEELMADETMAMHGPEHHALVPAVLVTAYRNKTGNLGEQAIIEAIQRGSKVPGGFCGIYGACGAGIGAGIAVSIITGSTPLKAEPRALSNRMTGEALLAIAAQGGIRCCKASSRLALEVAAQFLQDRLNCRLDRNDTPRCAYMNRNAQCNLTECRYFPVRKARKA